MSKENSIFQTQINYYENLEKQGHKLSPKEEEQVQRLYRIMAWYEQQKKQVEEAPQK